MSDSASSDLESRARQHHYRSLTPKEYEALNHYRAEWAQTAADAEHRFFILGSFSDDDVDRLDEFKRHVNEEATDSAVAYRMDDFLDDSDLTLNAILKFKLLADDSHYIVHICEHDEGGQMIEQGLLIESRAYIEKTHLLKRTYDDEQEKDRYSWMQSFGVFEIFHYHDCVYEWTDSEDFRATVETLVGELT